MTSLPYADVVATSATVAATRSRLAKTSALAGVLRECSADEVGVVASHLSGVVPQGRLGVGYRSLASRVAPAPGPTLTVADVDAAFTALASAAGQGSAARRRAVLDDLLGRATDDEQAFLAALMTGELRQGALDGVLLPAIGEAFEVELGLVRRAAMLAGSAAAVAEAAATGGSAAVAAIGLEVMRAVRPMLAGSAPTVADAVTGDVLVQCKLDGIRIQVHRDGDDVRIFTRSLDDITSRLPEVVEVARSLPLRSAVLDGEAIALHPDGRPQPFQVTGARTASTGDPEALRAKVPLTTFLFDVIHLDGRDLLDEPLETRWETLRQVAPAHLPPTIRTTDVVEAQAFFDELVEQGQEGVVVKSLHAPYAAGRRGDGWTKVKPRHTLDLVVLAVEWGSGRRTGRLSNIHLGARHGDGFVMLGKTFKGMTDQMLEWQTERFLELATDRGDWVVHVRPEQVVEIAFDGLQTSTRYPGGVALRFARVLRYRDDKTAAEADTLETVLALARRMGTA